MWFVLEKMCLTVMCAVFPFFPEIKIEGPV